MTPVPLVFQIPSSEKQTFGQFIKSYRQTYIRTSQAIVDKVFNDNPDFVNNIKHQKASQSIAKLRELAWDEYLKDEINFNIILMQNLHTTLKTPRHILKSIVNYQLIELPKNQLLEEVRRLCGEYSGRIFPYIYQISLSNTNSRRSRAGKVFEVIIYKVYDVLGFEFDSQSKVGRKIFTELGLGKKVDSILPNVSCYEKRRNKTIIGIMRASLKNWREIAQEIRREIPVVHLLTTDSNISIRKIKDIAKHNIVVVAYEWVACSDTLKSMQNVISFEEYFFEEIPTYCRFWDPEI